MTNKKQIDVEKVKSAIKDIIGIKIENTIKFDSNLVDLSAFYVNLKDHIEMIKKGYIKTLFVIGNSGLGKTSQISNWLADCNVVKISGYISPKRLYENLYNNRNNKIIFFDDTEGLLNNNISLTILKQALDTCEERVISWDTSKGKQDLPNSFVFNSRVIFCLNSIPNDNGFKAIMSRADKVTVWFDYNKILELMKAIATKERIIKTEKETIVLSTEERKQIVEWIIKNSDASVENFDLRTQYKIENYYAFSKDRWQQLALEMLSKRNEKTALLLDIMSKYEDVKEQIKAWTSLTGLSKRAYYRAKAKLGDKVTFHSNINKGG
jgi:hypothetical protein